jgi:hypothetical protein
MIQTDVAEACAAGLMQAVTVSDPSVWLIRELNLDLTVTSDPSQAEVAARQLGERLASTIQRTIARGDEDGSVLRFPNRAAYVAQFVRDVATGIAWGKWYYEEFLSLLSLSASRAICEALTAQPDHIGPALVSLIAIRGLQQVLSRLTENDARDIFEAWRNALQPFSSATGESAWVGRLLQVWSETPFRETNAGSEYHPFRDGLWWAALAVQRHSGEEASRALLEAVRNLLDLRYVLSILDIGSRGEVIRCLARGDVDSATTMAVRQGAYDPSATLEFYRRNMQGDQDWAREAQGVLLGEQEYLRKAAAAKVIAHGPAIPSPHAGVFRLGPSFLASGCHNALTDLDEDQAAVVRHLVAVKCLGRDRAIRAAGDSALRLFSGFGGAGFVDALGSPALTGRGWPATELGSCWLLDTVEVPFFGQAIFLRNVWEDAWVWASFYGPTYADWEDVVERAVSCASGLSDTSSPVLLLRAEQATSVKGVISMNRDPGTIDQLAREMQFPPRQFQRGLRSIAKDVSYFSLGEAFPEIPAELDLAATLLARAVLKHFARRLVGFDNSSADHLYRSFLAGLGFVRDTGERMEVELPQPPLSIILSMAGMLEEIYTLPWIEGREICLLRSPE